MAITELADGRFTVDVDVTCDRCATYLSTCWSLENGVLFLRVMPCDCKPTVEYDGATAETLVETVTAPDLLAACEVALEALQEYGMVCNTITNTVAYEALVAAIAKAKGTA